MKAQSWFNLRGFLPVIRGNEFHAVLVMVTSLFSFVFEGASLALLVPFLESIESKVALSDFWLRSLGVSLPDDSYQRFQIIGFVLLALIGLKAVSTYLHSLCSASFQAKIFNRLRILLSDSFYREQYSHFIRRDSAKLFNIYSVQTDCYLAYLAGLIQLIHSSVYLLGYATLLLCLSPKASVFGVGIAVCVFAITTFANRFVIFHSAKRLEELENSARVLLDDLVSMPLLRVFKSTNQRAVLHKSYHQGFYKHSMKVAQWMGVPSHFTEIFVAVTVFGAALLNRGFQSDQGSHLAFAFGYSFIFYKLYGQTHQLSRALTSMAANLPETKNISELLGPKALEKEGLKVRNVEKLELSGVSFRYDDEEIVKDLNLTLRRGEIVSLVGLSGVGKSTLIYLLSGLFEVEKGKVRIDEGEWQSIEGKPLDLKVSVVFEESTLFNESILFNLTCGRDIPMNEIIDATKMADIHSFIDSLPEGYHTHIKFQGVRLSSGQRRRIALARAFLMQPEFLVLDEATNNLDRATETTVLESIRRKSAGMFVVMVSHKAEVVRFSDRVILLNRGHIERETSSREFLDATQ